MTIQEAIKSGRLYRRAQDDWGWCLVRDNHFIQQNGITFTDHSFTPEDILATDWEVLVCEKCNYAEDCYLKEGYDCPNCPTEVEEPFNKQAKEIEAFAKQLLTNAINEESSTDKTWIKEEEKEFEDWKKNEVEELKEILRKKEAKQSKSGWQQMLDAREEKKKSCGHNWKWMGRFEEKAFYLFRCVACGEQKEESIQEYHDREGVKKIYTTPEEDPLGAPYLPTDELNASVGEGSPLDFVMIELEFPIKKKCTCGSDSIGGGGHADYCDKIK